MPRLQHSRPRFRPGRAPACRPAKRARTDWQPARSEDRPPRCRRLGNPLTSTNHPTGRSKKLLRYDTEIRGKRSPSRRYGRRSRFAGWLCSRLGTELSVGRSALWLTLLGSFASLFAASQPWSLGRLRLRSAQFARVAGSPSWGRVPESNRVMAAMRVPERIKTAGAERTLVSVLLRPLHSPCKGRLRDTARGDYGSIQQHLSTWPNNGERIGLMPRAPRYRHCGPAPLLSALAWAEPDATAQERRVFRDVRPYRSGLGGPPHLCVWCLPGALPVFPIGM
jgi:hypothetical protein